MLRIGHPAFSTRRSHEAPRWGGRPGSGAGDEASRTGGRKRSVIRIRSVERREAQRLGGKASQTFRSPPRAPRDGPRKPVLARCAATARAGLASLRLPMRGLANPWRLPALHSPFGETEKGTGGARAETNKQGSAALATRGVIPGRDEVASPESIIPSSEIETLAARHREDRGYGFRAPRCARPGMTKCARAPSRNDGSSSSLNACSGITKNARAQKPRSRMGIVPQGEHVIWRSAP